MLEEGEAENSGNMEATNSSMKSVDEEQREKMVKKGKKEKEKRPRPRADEEVYRQEKGRFGKPNPKDC